jgi:HK97 family phage major capsid protein
MNTFELRQKRASVWQEMQDLTERAEAEKRTLSAEEITRWEALEAELSNLTKQIEIAERDAELRKTIATVVDTPPVAPTRDPEAERRQAFLAYLRHGPRHMTPEQIALLGEQRALGVGSGAAGGYTVPAGFRAIITETMKSFGGIRRLAEVISTTSGQPMPWPTNDDTGNVGELLAENTQLNEQDVTFGQKSLGAYPFNSKIVRVSVYLLQDSGIDIEGFLGRKLGQRIGRAQATYWATGTGTNQPQGAVTGATQGKVGAAGQTTSVTYDDLVDLVYSVDSAYRDGAAFVMHDTTIAKVRKLKDSTGQPLWQPSVMAGQPDTLLGFPVVSDAAIPQMAANAKSILFGNFRAGYVIRDVADVSLLRLEERYADFLQVGFLAFVRSDGLVADSAAIKYYQNSAT